MNHKQALEAVIAAWDVPIVNGDTQARLDRVFEAVEAARAVAAAPIPESVVLSVAAALFPDEVATGQDCRAEIGREGQPCRACADQNAQWQARIEQVRQALIANL